MNIRAVRLLLDTAARTPKRQILSRVRLMFWRRCAVWLCRASLLPMRWFGAPAPRRAARSKAVEQTQTGHGRRSLPLQLNLAGTPYTVDVGIDWHPAQLERGTRLEKLTLHYMTFLEELEESSALNLIRDWIRQNPPFRPGYWMGDWNSYALSIRIVTWMNVLQRSQGIENPEGAVVVQSLAAQLRFLERNLEVDIGGNHLVKNIRALIRGGAFFEGDEPLRWRRLGEKLLATQLDVQVLPDGMHFELSPAYHLQVFCDLLDCYAALEASSLRGRLGQALDSMAAVVTDMTHPDGLPSLFNDGGLNMSVAPDTALRTFEAVRGCPRPLPRSLWVLPNAGYVGLRSGDTLLIVDCGAVGPGSVPAHAHGDALAFEWSVAGRRVIVDPGVYEYHEGAKRDYSRSTAAHNTVTLDSLDQAEFWSSFRVARRPAVHLEHLEMHDGGFTLRGSHDGYKGLAGSPVHRRQFQAGAQQVHVRDEVVGGRGQRAQARMLLAPGARATAVNAGLIRITLEDIVILLETEAAVRFEEGLWMPNFGVQESSVRIVLDYGRAPCGGDFVLTVQSSGDWPQ